MLGLAKNPKRRQKRSLCRRKSRKAFYKAASNRNSLPKYAMPPKVGMRGAELSIKAEHPAKAGNPRFVPTSLCDAPEQLRRHCRARGERENRIKGQELRLFADRTSCGKWLLNQFRVPLSARRTRRSPKNMVFGSLQAHRAAKEILRQRATSPIKCSTQARR